MTFKVFISGNQTELSEERFAVKDVINNNPVFKRFFDVFLFEEVPASRQRPDFTYLKEVKDSDIFIGILGKKYGNIDEEGLSPTEKEFKTFIEHNPHNDIFIFVKGSRDEIRDEKIEDLIGFIMNSVTYKRFDDLDDLKECITENLIIFFEEKGPGNTVPFDEKVHGDLDYSILVEEELIEFLQKRAFKLHVDVPSIPLKDIFVDVLKVVKHVDGEFKPTNTALLFFSQNPADYLPQDVIKIARYNGNTRLETIDNKEITGPIYKMIKEVEVFFKRNTRLANKIVDFKRIDIPEYPFEAIREALINAIAHRDYNQRGAHIMFSIFEDRIEVVSPGGLLPGLKINDLEGKHKARNHLICSIFHETKDMERFGTGMEKMNRVMVEHGLKEPELSEEGDYFVVKFFGPGDKILDLVSDIPDERKTDLKELGLNDRQIDALRLMVNDNKVFTNKIYQDMFKVSRNTASRHLNEMVELNQIQKIGKGRYTKYKAN
ncbi:ATP-binding protein [Methanobacterium sp.]|uniref:ATP-binding protein n=1 Tax=Methanobacterium sp. TaxID=2164 RepID=UPI003C70C3C2